jgi:hypothetical protein
MISREQLKAEYLDYLNNYLSIDKFAEHRGLTHYEAEWLINAGRFCFMFKHPEA